MTNIRRRITRTAALLVSASSLAKATPCTHDDELIATGTAPELLIKINATAAGYLVELTAPMQKPHWTEHQQPLPHDRGVEQLISLATEQNGYCPRSEEAQAVQEFGTSLFHSVFANGGEHVLRASLDLACRSDAVLRIVLQVDQAFADIPWEYLFDPERGAFLARSHETTLVRQLQATQATRPQSDIGQLRILSMATSPHATESLDIGSEQQQTRDALAPSISAGQVSLDFVNGGTFADLATALRVVKPHVLHIAAHGAWNTELDDAAVLFEDVHGFPQPRTGIDIGALLNQPGMRLAIFSCCHAATPSKNNRLAGIVPSLVAQGIPAAIGMQFAFDDKAAGAFSGAFLRELAAGTPADQAMTRARLAVFANSYSIDWATPVLTTRVPIDEILPRS